MNQRVRNHGIPQRLPSLPRPGTKTVRRTAHTVPREAVAETAIPRPLSPAARKIVLRHAQESRNEIPEWAYRDLVSALETAEALDAQLRIVRSKLSLCLEALRLASDSAADAARCAKGLVRRDADPQA